MLKLEKNQQLQENLTVEPDSAGNRYSSFKNDP